MQIRQKLKTLRVIIALLFFITTSFIFLDIYAFHDHSLDNPILFFQFVPSLVQCLKIFTWSALGFISIILLTVFFGRIYCSTICPLGTLQDVLLWIFRKTGIIKKYRFKKPHYIIRYTFLLLTIISLLAGSMLITGLLDPYSNYGRMMANIGRPYLVEINNLIAGAFIKMKIYSLQTFHSDISNTVSIAYPFAFFILILLFTLFGARQYCNTICPVGTLLGLFARFSIFKISFNAKYCTNCGSCTKSCKAGCIDLRKKQLDFSRCVACYNCIGSCPQSAINYHFHREKRIEKPAMATDDNKRKFLAWSSVFLLTAVATACKKKVPVKAENALIPFERKTAVSPPGSVSLSNFNTHCTACHLCVSACPTQVLQPAMLEYGWQGILQPTMDFESNFCNYNCNICSHVCPSGAILTVELPAKQRIQIGIARFIEQNCVVYTNQKDCGACSEHCPTKACDMVPANENSGIKSKTSDPLIYHSGLKIPKITTNICIGCGACEYACPVIPDKAIIVDGNTNHLTAHIPKKEKAKEYDSKADFPF